MANITTSDVPVEVIIFLSLMALILFYLIFFQQFLSAFILRCLLKLFRRDGIILHFQRFSLSILTGQITLHRVTVVTEDMSIFIGRICISVFYWRKISEYTSLERESKRRTNIAINGLEVNIFNRTWMANFVEDIVNKFNEGDTTEQVTEYYREQYPAIESYQLPILIRICFPCTFLIDGASVDIGNPNLPSVLVFSTETIRGNVDLNPPEDETKSLRLGLECKMYSVNFNSVPHTFKPPEIFDNSMRNIQERSRYLYNVLQTDMMQLSFELDLYGCYVLDSDRPRVCQVTAEPQEIIKISFNGYTQLEYGPYLDKLRMAFQVHFAPWLFTNTVLFSDAKTRIQKTEIYIDLPAGTKVVMPFVTLQDKDENLTVILNKPSQCVVFSPLFVSKVIDNKVQVTAELLDVQIFTSISAEPFITAGRLLVDYLQFNPEKWYGVTQVTISAKLEESRVLLIPYYIDFISDIGSDWGAPMCYQTTVDDVSNFFPFSYFITLKMEPVTIRLFQFCTPPFEQVNQSENVPHVDAHFGSFVAKMAEPMLVYKEHDSGLSFSAEVEDANIEFLLPVNHLMTMRRNSEIKDHIIAPKLNISGTMRWYNEEDGLTQALITIKVPQMDGLVTVSTFDSMITMINNLASFERKVPEDIKDLDNTRPIANIHSNIVLAVETGSLKVPIDLYDPTYCMKLNVSDLLMSIENMHPFWHNMLNITCATIVIPKTNYPYDEFYNEVLGGKEGMSEGLLHVDGIQYSLKTVQSKNPENKSLNMKANVDCPGVTGYLTLPQLFSTIEFVINLVYMWFSVDIKDDIPYDPFWWYMIRVVTVRVGPIQLFIDASKLGIVSAIVPGGATVYADNLIDHNGHYTVAVELPSLDVINLVTDENTKRLKPNFRVSTYFTFFETFKFGEPVADGAHQAQMLRLFDKEEHLMPFLWENASKYDEELFELPEMMKPETFKTSLDENFKLVQVMKTDPFNNQEYTLPVPKLEYKSFKSFCDYETNVRWMHRYEFVRHYQHNFPTNHSRKSRAHELISNEKDLQYNPPDVERYEHGTMDMHIGLPDDVVIQMKPDAINMFSAIFEILNLKPDCQYLANIVRWDGNNASLAINFDYSIFSVIAKKVSLRVLDTNFMIQADIENIKVFLQTLIDGTKPKVSVMVNSVSLNSKLPSDPNQSIEASIPNILVAVDDSNVTVKADAVNAKLTNSSMFLLDKVLNGLVDYIREIPAITAGQRAEEFDRLLSMNPNFQKYIDNLMIDQYYLANPMIPTTITARHTAYYLMYRELNFERFSKTYNLLDIPSKPFDHIKHETVISLPIIHLNYLHVNDQTDFFANIAPVSITSEDDKTAVSACVTSLTFVASPQLISALQHIPQVKKSNKIQFPEVNNVNQTLMIHGIVNSVNIKLQEINVGVDQVAAAVSTRTEEGKLKNLSIISTINQISAGIGEDLKFNLEGVDFYKNMNEDEAILHVKPINVYSTLDFVVNPIQILRILKQIQMIPQFQQQTKVRRSRPSLPLRPTSPGTRLSRHQIPKRIVWDDSTEESLLIQNEPKNEDEFVDDMESFIDSKKLGSSLFMSGFDSTEEEVVALPELPKKPLIDEFIAKLSLSLLVDPINVEMKINDKNSLNLSLPRISGLTYSRDNQILYFLYMHSPFVKSLDLEFPLTDLIVHGFYDLMEMQLMTVVILGNILARANSDHITSLVGIIEDVLMKIDTSPVPFKPLNPPKPQDSPLFVSLRCVLPDFEIELPEIKTSLQLKPVLFNFESHPRVDWELEVSRITLQVSDSSISTSVNLFSLENSLALSIPHFDVNVSTKFFTFLPTIIHHVQMIQTQLEKNQKIKEIIDDVNDQIHTKIEESKKKRISKQSKKELRLPKILESQTMIEVVDFNITVALPSTGNFLFTIPMISLLLQTRRSTEFVEIATAANLMIEDIKIIFDTKESVKQTDSKLRLGNQEETESLSTINLHKIAATAIIFNSDVIFNGNFDGLKVDVFPTIPTAIFSIVSMIQENLASVSTNLPAKQDENVKINPQINGSLSLTNLEINLCPISNIIPIQEIKLGLNLDTGLHLTVNVSKLIKISLSPALITWLRIMKMNIKPINLPKSDQQTQTPLPFDLALQSSGMEIKFGCQPTRSDISFIVGFNKLSMLMTDKMNLNINSISLKTENVFAPQSGYARTSRLFELLVPRLDLWTSKSDIIINTDRVEISISSDKIEEITVFWNVWVNDLIKVLASDEIDDIKEKIAQPIEDPPTLVVNVPSFDFFFNFASGAGNFLTKISKLKLEQSGKGTFVSVPSITINNFGQLTSELMLENLLFSRIFEKKEKILFGGMFERFSLSMKSFDDQFFSFSINQTNFMLGKQKENLCNFMFSTDSPSLKLTSQTVPILLSFYHTISDPILKQITLPDETKASIKPNKEKIMKPMNTKITVLTTGFQLELFRYYFKDTESHRLLAEQINMIFNISSENEKNVVRNLKVSALPVSISRLNLESEIIRDILKTPSFVLNLSTNQNMRVPNKIHYDFVTYFQGSLEPSLALTDYESLLAVIKYTIKQLKLDEIQPKKNVGVKTQQNNKEQKINYQFEPGEYEFNPGIKVGVGASFSPDIQWLMHQFGIEDEHLIPASLFENVCLGLEDMSLSINDGLVLDL